MIQFFRAIAYVAFASKGLVGGALDRAVEAAVQPPAPNPCCFYCKGSGRISRSPEGLAFYKLRQEAMRAAGGNRTKATDLVRQGEAQWAQAQRGQVSSGLGRALDRIEQFRVR